MVLSALSYCCKNARQQDVERALKHEVIRLKKRQEEVELSLRRALTSARTDLDSFRDLWGMVSPLHRSRECYVWCAKHQRL